jgi:hypothetical protein
MPKYQVYYARRPTFRPCGQFGTPLLTVSTLAQSHVHLGEVEGKDLDDAWRRMQGEHWSPDGEARRLVLSLGLSHTSMSVGDVLRDEAGVYWECLDHGWRPLADDTQGDGAHGQR